MRRGEVWWADMPKPAGRRPVVLLSRNAAYEIRTSITVGTVTRTVREIPSEVPLGLEDGMPQACVVNLDDIITIPKARLTERITSLSARKMSAIAKAIGFALDLQA